MLKIAIFAGFKEYKGRMKHNIFKIILSLTAAITLFSCEQFWCKPTEPKSYNRVMLLYSAGFNNLSSYLKGDIEELKNGALPEPYTENVVLVYSHFPTSAGYNTPSSPTLVRLTSTKDNTVHADTLVTFPDNSISASAAQIENVLTYIKDNFPAQSYGMVFSSHATGYLPAGYYQNPDTEVFPIEWQSSLGRRLTAVPYVEPEYDPSLPMVKSIGQDQVGPYGEYISYEINLNDFADAIPMKLDYLLFDACLMGGIEVAYEFREKVGKIGFSQTEVLADGFCYENLTTHLLGGDEPDLVSVCSDYFNQYEVQTGVYQSATISLVDCSKLSPVADVCKDLFSRYKKAISRLNPNNVQRYYRMGKHWFYDLESILINAGISDEELKNLHSALDNCVIYKAHTPKFMSDFDIHTFSGFSMYLPCDGSLSLDEFYKNLEWNKDTGLVN